MSTPRSIASSDYDNKNLERPGVAMAARRRFQPAAQYVTWGVLGLIIGQFIYEAGQQAALTGSASYSGRSSGATFAIVVGGVVALVGLVYLVLGVHRLATNVDVAAKVALDSAVAASAARGADSLPNAAPGRVVR